MQYVIFQNRRIISTVLYILVFQVHRKHANIKYYVGSLLCLFCIELEIVVVFFLTVELCISLQSGSKLKLIFKWSSMIHFIVRFFDNLFHVRKHHHWCSGQWMWHRWLGCRISSMFLLFSRRVVAELMTLHIICGAVSDWMIDLLWPWCSVVTDSNHHCCKAASSLLIRSIKFNDFGFCGESMCVDGAIAHTTRSVTKPIWFLSKQCLLMSVTKISFLPQSLHTSLSERRLSPSNC